MKLSAFVFLIPNGGECPSFPQLWTQTKHSLVPGVGRPPFHQKIFHWLWLKAVWPQLVWGLQLRTPCVAFARSLHILTHTCVNIYTPKMRPVAGWGEKRQSGALQSWLQSASSGRCWRFTLFPACTWWGLSFSGGTGCCLCSLNLGKLRRSWSLKSSMLILFKALKHYIYSF